MTVVNDAEVLWTEVCKLLAEQISESVWLSCFKDAHALYVDENCLTIEVPTAFIRDRIDQRYRGLVIGAVNDAGHGASSLEIRVNETATEHNSIDPLVSMASDNIGEIDLRDVDAAPRDDASNDLARNNASAITTDSSQSSTSLNAKYSFETFVTGSSNRFASAAALSVAETPARSYNPLFVYGDAGLGKTHLLQAIAHYIGENYPLKIVRYISTETMLNEFIDAIRNGKQAEFKRRYREIDVLLVDDVQFMEGKEQLQEEFFHTFNSLHQTDRQIVLSSDRSPDKVATLEERLRSRFKMGLVTDIQPPDFETRLAIMRQKAAQTSVLIPDEILEFIVNHVTNNIRELEGAFNRVTAYASFNNGRIELDDIPNVLGDIVTDDGPKEITPEMIFEHTAEMFGFTVAELKTHDRRRPLVLARQICMYLFRELTDLSYPQIAVLFGGRDHTTIIYGYDKIQALMQERRSVLDSVQKLITEIKQ